MLETMSNLSLCGVLMWNSSYEEVYCDDCGVLVFESYGDGGCWCITEVNVGEPIELPNTTGLIANLERGIYGPAIGVVYCKDGRVIVFKDEEKATVQRIGRFGVDIGEPFYYSTDEEYDVEK